MESSLRWTLLLLTLGLSRLSSALALYTRWTLPVPLDWFIAISSPQRLLSLTSSLHS
jgi:hypothetical protein